MANQQTKAKEPISEEKHADKVDQLYYLPQSRHCSSQEKENETYTCKMYSALIYFLHRKNSFRLCITYFYYLPCAVKDNVSKDFISIVESHCTISVNTFNLRIIVFMSVLCWTFIQAQTQWS